MSETPQDLSNVAETLLMTLYIRAMESQRPDALIKDEKAVALVTQMSYDFGRVRQVHMYQTWTTLFLIFCELVVVRRVLAEEKVLATTFGAEWTEYCSRVPMIFPRLFSLSRSGEG